MSSASVTDLIPHHFKRQPRLPTFAVPRRYALTLTPDLDACTFIGAVEIDIDVIDPTLFLVLNYLDLVIDAASVPIMSSLMRRTRFLWGFGKSKYEVDGIKRNMAVTQFDRKPGGVSSAGTNLLSRYFSVPFSLPKLDLVVIPDFSGGVKENYGLITFHDTVLLKGNSVHKAPTNVEIQHCCMMKNSLQLQTNNGLQLLLHMKWHTSGLGIW